MEKEQLKQEIKDTIDFLRDHDPRAIIVGEDVLKKQIDNVIDKHIPDGAVVLTGIDKGTTYAKVPEGSVVLTKEELESGITFNEVVKSIVRKETAREILNLIKPKCKICDKEKLKGCMCMQKQAEEAIKKAYSIVDEVKEEIEEDIPHKALFPNPCTKEKEAFETIIFQNRDNGYISDAYRNDIDVVCKGLNILHALQNKLENNVTTQKNVLPNWKI